MSNRKFIITLTDTSINRFHAGSKALQDAISTCINGGISSLVIAPFANTKGIICSLSLSLKIIYNVLFSVKGEDDVIINYTGYSVNLALLINLLKLRGIRFTLLIHDILTLRSYGKVSVKESKLFNLANFVIVHTCAMKNYLIDNGIKSKCVVLEIFDYYISKPNNNNVIKDDSIVFAGNLIKSTFLKEMYNIFEDSSYKINLYGVNLNNHHLPSFVQYKGKFSPEDVSTVEGKWGLVWDGDSSRTCSGFYGNYLKYISPHKLSLYIVAGIPVLVWSKSAMAKFVKDNNIGIVIDSLDDIIKKVSKVDNHEYAEMKYNLSKIADNLRKGFYLKKALNKVFLPK